MKALTDRDEPGRADRRALYMAAGPRAGLRQPAARATGRMTRRNYLGTEGTTSPARGVVGAFVRPGREVHGHAVAGVDGGGPGFFDGPAVLRPAGADVVVVGAVG